MMTTLPSPTPTLLPPTGPRSRKRWRLRAHNRISTNEHEHENELPVPVSPRYGFSPFRTQNRRTGSVCEEESKETEDVVIGSGSSSIILKITNTNTNTNTNTSDPTPSGHLPEIPVVPSFQMPHSIGKNLEGHPDPNESFETQETVSSSDSESEDDMSHASNASCSIVSDEDEEDNDSSSTTSSTTSSQDSSSSSHSKRSIRFADEVGLPIQKIRHYQCDRKEREHSELLVLCLFPERKKFEFLHVGYHHQYGGDNKNNGTGTGIRNLLRALPGMCSDPLFSVSKFDALYRANKADKAFVNLCLCAAEDENADPDANPPADRSASDAEFDSLSDVERDSDSEGGSLLDLTLTECAFKENELVVASVRGSPERAVLEGIGSLLSNDKIVKTLKRARRSRRSLQFVPGPGEMKSQTNTNSRQRKRPSSKDKKSQTTKTKDVKKKSETDCRSTTLIKTKTTTKPDCTELLDVYCDDYDPLRDESEFFRQLLVGVVAVGTGTAVFSALGIK